MAARKLLFVRWRQKQEIPIQAAGEESHCPSATTRPGPNRRLIAGIAARVEELAAELAQAPAAEVVQ
jgi:hypothetical protein